MEHRKYGRSGLQISALSLGAMTFGEARGFMKGVHSDDAEARRVFDAALDAGIDTVDTANGYAEGRSEELLGQWMKGKRQSITLATKCRFPTLGGTSPMHPSQSGLSRQSILWNCEQSLRRLQTDVIDLYQVHMQDGSVPIEETLRALDDLVRSGKVRYVGCSNYTGYRLAESLWAADRRGLCRFEGIQLQWNLVARDAERELVPAARAFGLGLLVWSPLARGF
ncbi:MAG TPA: aldo/keto reductase, partial [Myxococcales bacterium]|nr:aldo/keto reductase [Myxococcales bacterium]